ncbi:MAG: hypothetical protein D0528_02840 [Methylococcales bacterium]|nr:MAG: hypothetical protein D0528_02840 [Methylococcales bacterium]
MNNLAFEIGFDHYRFDLPLDLSRFEGKHRQQVQYGFEAGKIQNVSKQHSNKFEKKILSIRDRCLRTGLEVTITSADLITKLELTRGVCPIIEEPFTFAHQEMTDWSVDRVDNDRGYHPDNIEIVSVKANKAKGDLDLASIIEQAVSKFNPNSMLTQKQWFLMGRFYYQRLTLTEPLMMTAILYSSPDVFFKVICMQLYFPDTKHAKVFLKILAQYTTKEAIRKVIKLILKRTKAGSSTGLFLVLNSPKLRDAVFDFIVEICKHYLEFDEILTECFFQLPAYVLDKNNGK